MSSHKPSSRHWVPGVGWRPGGTDPRQKKDGRPPKTLTANAPAPPAGRKLPNSAPPAKRLRSNSPAVPERPLPIEGRGVSKLPAERGPGDGVGKGAVLRVFFEGFGWATGHVQKVTRDGAVDVFWVSDASYSTITRSVAAAHVVLPALVSAPMHALASKNGVVGCRGL
jgi:hypothetical protein